MHCVHTACKCYEQHACGYFHSRIFSCVHILHLLTWFGLCSEFTTDKFETFGRLITDLAQSLTTHWIATLRRNLIIKRQLLSRFLLVTTGSV